MADETIEVRYKKVPYEGSGAYHKYIIYTDKNGDQYIARGGPEKGDDYEGRGGTVNTLPLMWFGRVVTEVKPYDLNDPRTPDRDDPSNGFDPSETIISGADLSGYWEGIVESMNSLNNFHYQYQPMGQNSNAAVDDALERAGLPPATLDDELMSPGSDTSFVIFYPDAVLGELPDWISDALGPVFGTPGHAPPLTPNPLPTSPLVLDINGDGAINLVSLDNSTVNFDFWSDGFAERAGWVAPGDGFLVRDVDNDGNATKDFGSNLFGLVGG